MIITYCGNLINSECPYSLFSALSQMKDKAFEFKLRFYGQVQDHVREVIRDYGIDDCVEYHGWKDKPFIVQKMEESDVLLLCIPKTKDAKLIPTSKLFEYIAARRPILNIGPVDGEAARIIQETESGITVGWNDSKSCFRVLHGLYITIKNGWMIDFKYELYPEPEPADDPMDNVQSKSWWEVVTEDLLYLYIVGSLIAGFVLMAGAPIYLIGRLIWNILF